MGSARTSCKDASPEQLRQSIAATTLRHHKSALGQFMTPEPVARFMASLFQPATGPCRLLDPGAGLGALASAAMDRWVRREFGSGKMELVAHELDDQLRPHLEGALADYARAGACIRVVGGDYLAHAADAIDAGRREFTHAILNPPYKKIGNGSDARRLCRRVGLETVNLYSAFVGMALAQLAPGGQLVAIIPRSFCNGPYYKRFREFVLSRAAIKHIHLFDRRDQAFSDDDVLQENVILLLERDGVQRSVRITTSHDGRFDNVGIRDVPFKEVVKPDDNAAFIHIPSNAEVDPLEGARAVRHTLPELGIAVSTGPVVDFRMREHLVAMPGPGTVPLLYPGHLSGGQTTWPIAGMKKPNAIARNAVTERWLFPAGVYAVVRRFSSKEERRRVVASVVVPKALGRSTAIGFENHLNVFHQKKAGLPSDLAWGLFAYLNSTAVDKHFRRFNGHTQVNATDLRALCYPSRAALTTLGQWAQVATSLDQYAIDQRIKALLA